MFVKLKGWFFPSSREVRPESKLAFHWGYIIFPLFLLLISVVIVAYFYRLLPAEVSYHFGSDGSPDKWLPRSTIILWFIIPQLILVILAVVTTWGVTRLAVAFSAPDSTWIMPQRTVQIMGNMVALPQMIVSFAMLDIFSYNSYQIHLMPLWVFAVVVMGLGGIVLGIFFTKAIRQTQRASQ